MWTKTRGLSDRRGPTALRSGRGGATALEVALIIGCWTVIFVGIFDLGIATLRRNLTAHIARQAARLAIVRGSSSGPELTPWGPATQTVGLGDRNELANTLRPLAGGISTSAFQVKLEWIDGNNDPESRVRVTVSANYESVLGGAVGRRIIPMQAKSTMPIVH